MTYRTSRLEFFLEKAALFVLPSRGEGFAIVLEAAAFALPIIATDVDRAADLILHGENGRLVPSENASKLSDEILNILIPHSSDEVAILSVVAPI